jgi:hypothetical protein
MAACHKRKQCMHHLLCLEHEQDTMFVLVSQTRPTPRAPTHAAPPTHAPPPMRPRPCAPTQRLMEATELSLADGLLDRCRDVAWALHRQAPPLHAGARPILRARARV